LVNHNKEHLVVMARVAAQLLKRRQLRNVQVVVVIKLVNLQVPVILVSLTHAPKDNSATLKSAYESLP
jgi:hypothetical protein